MRNPHLPLVNKALRDAGLAELTDDKLIINRTDKRTSTKGMSTKNLINGQPVTPQLLQQIAGPLFLVVDAAGAAASFNRPQSRLAMIDTAVDNPTVNMVRETHRTYKEHKKKRQSLEKELASLPLSITGERDEELLQHWIDELDAFGARMEKFSGSCRLSELVVSTLAERANEISHGHWTDMNGGSATQYTALMEFRDSLNDIDDQIQAANQARDTIGSLSAPDSATTAVERARSLLLDRTTSADPKLVQEKFENVHSGLNKIEDALQECIEQFDHESKGLISYLEATRASINVSLEDVDAIIGEWNLLARKHQIPPTTLPLCYKTLQQELDGNLEARTELPLAVQKEKEALEALGVACEELSAARKDVAQWISSAINNRLPALGMEGSSFQIRSEKSAILEKATASGVDAVSLILQHGDKSRGLGGEIEFVASSGEKARIMLALECEIPGAAGALCGVGAANRITLPPIAVVYDEIDAHVGGHAAVSMAKMISEQAGQKICITHSPSVAAAGKTHLIVHKFANGGTDRVPVKVIEAGPDERRKELARMASGDLATVEAEQFAQALLDDGAFKGPI